MLVISNHNNFRLLFDEIASIYFLEQYIHILALEPRRTGTVPTVSAHFRSNSFSRCVATTLYLA